MEEGDQALSRLLREAAPLYEAPPECVERVHELLRAAGDRPKDARKRSRWLPGRVLSLVRARILVPSVAMAALALVGTFALVRQARANNYVHTAVGLYQTALANNLSLGIRSDSPQAVTAWVSDRVPFSFRLPGPAIARGGLPTYRLAGASLVDVKGGPAALVTYEKGSEKIALLVTSEKYALIAGGHHIQHQDITFHYFDVESASVITWTTRGLCYALVGSFSGREQGLKPCLVCHQYMPDRHLFQKQR